MRPLNDRILIRIDKADEKIGSIIIPDSAKTRPQFATVIAVGPGAMTNAGRREPEVKKGDRVLIGKYSGSDVEIDGEKLTVVREEDLLGVVE